MKSLLLNVYYVLRAEPWIAGALLIWVVVLSAACSGVYIGLF